jgi:hypothetical protein
MSYTICKYCNKLELVFDNAHKSKSGRLIPLDKQSGLPHQCSESPYTKQQQHQQSGGNIPTEQAQTEAQRDITKTLTTFNNGVQEELLDIINRLTRLENKTDRIANLIYALTGEPIQPRNHDNGTLLDNRYQRNEIQEILSAFLSRSIDEDYTQSGKD